MNSKVIQELSPTMLQRLAYKAKSSTSDTELLPVYTDEGELKGTASRFLCHRLGLIHAVVFVFVIDERGNLLIQERGDGRIDIPVGGHVAATDKSCFAAALRESKEELGIDLTEENLTEFETYLNEASPSLAKPQTINRELRHLYLVRADSTLREQLHNCFAERFEQHAVKSIQWLSCEDTIKCCDKGMAADGLRASLPHLLMRVYCHQA